MKAKINKTKKNKVNTRFYHAGHTHEQLKGLISDLYHVDDKAVENLAATIFALTEDKQNNVGLIDRVEFVNLCMVSAIRMGGAREYFEKSGSEKHLVINGVV